MLTCLQCSGPLEECKLKIFFCSFRPFTLSEAILLKCAVIDMTMVFCSYTNKTHFYKKGFALSLALKMRVLLNSEIACSPLMNETK